MTRRDATLGEVLLAIKDTLISNGMGTDANVRISDLSPDEPPPSPQVSDSIWIITPGTELKRNLGVTLGDQGNMILNGTVNLTYWLRMKEIEEPGGAEIALTHPTLGANGMLQTAMNVFDEDNSTWSNLCNSSGESPLMESMTLLSVLMPHRLSGTAWKSFTLQFDVMFRVRN